jgi:coproporphyrinogen III oxidase-like Fe-S oxidoreductase
MSFLTSIISLVVRTAQAIGKRKFTDIALDLITSLPKAIIDGIAYGKLDTVEKVDEALAELDLRTGSDEGAMDILRDLPSDKEELLFDHLKEAIRIIAKSKLKVEGYHINVG